MYNVGMIDTFLMIHNIHLYIHNDFIIKNIEDIFEVPRKIIVWVENLS